MSVRYNTEENYEENYNELARLVGNPSISFDSKPLSARSGTPQATNDMLRFAAEAFATGDRPALSIAHLECQIKCWRESAPTILHSSDISELLP